MEYLYDALREEVKDEIAKDDRPDTFDEFASKIIKVDNRLYARRLERNGRGNRQSNQPRRNQANVSRRRGGSTAYGFHPGPMELDAANKKTFKCYNCGKPGHMANKCKAPKKPWKPVAEGRNVSAASKELPVRNISMANSEVYYSPDDCEYDLASVDDTTDEDGDWEFGTQPTYENQGGETTPNFKTGEEESKAETTEIPEEYSKYSKLFSDELETGLPEHSRWDHEIKLQPGTEPTFNKIYPQNPEQDAALEEYLEEMLRKGYIRPSESPAGHPVLWVPKKNGKLRPCIDYRPLNKITIKNRYPLPLIVEIRDKVGKAKYFTTLDLRGAYNLIRMKEATFQTMIDTILRKQIGVFVVVYLDDILIYSNTLEEHKQYVHEVLQTLQDNKLLVEVAKCKFHQSSVQFLGFIVTHGEIQMCQDKIKAIKEWPTPTNVRDVRAFTAFVNFYRKFLKGYGDISRPLTDLTKKDVEFKWTEKEEKSFTTIKELVTQEPVMKTPDPERPYEVETDASDYALGGQLGQRDDEGRLYPVAFFSQKLHGPELNYGIHDKELMAIIQCFKEWRHYLVGAKHKIKVYTDHKNLTSFLTTKDLNKRQIRWYETLTDYDFEIIYRKGSENGRADALSRREDLKSEEQVDNAPLLRATKDGNLVLGTQEIDITWQAKPDETWMQRIASHSKNDNYLDNWETKTHLRKEAGSFLYNERHSIPKERIPINRMSTVQRLNTELGIQRTNQSRIQILGRSRKDPCGLLKLFRFLPFHTLQFFDIVDTTRDRTHHFLEP
ncbi:pol protein [Cordyceps javanica]|uniref:Pol protein n=1 Tax=Cordyceps javanica TaxID=43265 RepID=A0A545UW70_9HYPO|nr:pol protein [Cordyceps javanica]